MELEAHIPATRFSSSATPAKESLVLSEAGRKALFFAVALPFVVRAVVRVGWYRRRRLDELARRLRRSGAFRLGYLENPRYLAGTVDRILALGGREGRCLLRSLILLDLWSRCGLEARLCLGMVGSPCGRERQFHAWVTAGGEGVEEATPHREIWAG